MCQQQRGGVPQNYQNRKSCLAGALGARNPEDALWVSSSVVRAIEASVKKRGGLTWVSGPSPPIKIPMMDELLPQSPSGTEGPGAGEKLGAGAGTGSRGVGGGPAGTGDGDGGESGGSGGGGVPVHSLRTLCFRRLKVTLHHLINLERPIARQQFTDIYKQSVVRL